MMETKTIQWKAVVTEPPAAVRYCKKCGAKTEYVSTGLFRVNANQKKLDIWLIYKCHQCNTTWNSAIFERVNPKLLGVEQLTRFQNNDQELALFYSMNPEILKKNGAQPVNPLLSIKGEDVDGRKKVRICLSCNHHTKIKLEKVLREKLQISARILDEWIDKGFICLEDGCDIRKAKLQRDFVILIGS